jgi:hypothetical protein
MRLGQKLLGYTPARAYLTSKPQQGILANTLFIVTGETDTPSPPSLVYPKLMQNNQAGFGMDSLNLGLGTHIVSTPIGG